MQESFARSSFRPDWLLEECQAVLAKIAKSGKSGQQGLAAGALAGLSAALGVSKVGVATVCTSERRSSM